MIVFFLEVEVTWSEVLERTGVELCFFPVCSANDVFFPIGYRGANS
jgi:hypothetical protein